MRLVVAFHPHHVAGRQAALWERARAALRRHTDVVAELATRGDGEDAKRIAALLRETHPGVLVAAGGDGTINEAVDGLRRAGSEAALALLPFGTANNVARSLGLVSLRAERERAVDRAVDAILGDGCRRIDIGMVDERPFAGSFAIGMDADILAHRNRLRRRLGLGGEIGGYALYLWSCAVCLLSARPGGEARLVVDGESETGPIYNLLVTNAPIYAGEFRFDADNDCADGLLDLHRVGSAIEYLSEYPSAWRRHVRSGRGETVRASPHLRRAREILIESRQPMAAQIDGEEYGPATSYRVRVLPSALRVCVPH